MVTQADVFAVADRLTARGEKVTNRTIRAELGRGSFKHVSLHLRTWRGTNVGGANEDAADDIKERLAQLEQENAELKQALAHAELRRDAEIERGVRLMQRLRGAVRPGDLVDYGNTATMAIAIVRRLGRPATLNEILSIHPYRDEISPETLQAILCTRPEGLSGLRLVKENYFWLTSTPAEASEPDSE